MLKLRIRVREGFGLFKSNPSDMGYDVKAYSFAKDGVKSDSVTLNPTESAVVDIGVAVKHLREVININGSDYSVSFQVKSRSGLGFKSGIIAFEGQIDTTYNKSIMVKLTNQGDSSITLNKGDRIAQLVPVLVPIIDIINVENINDDESLDFPNAVRGGFGSTGL